MPQSQSLAMPHGRAAARVLQPQIALIRQGCANRINGLRSHTDSGTDSGPDCGRAGVKVEVGPRAEISILFQRVPRLFEGFSARPPGPTFHPEIRLFLAGGGLCDGDPKKL